jgi:hypothetical protein
MPYQKRTGLITNKTKQTHFLRFNKNKQNFKITKVKERTKNKDKNRK